MPARGRFIAFEGIDGSGKSSTLARVAKVLAAEGRPVWATKEETDGPSGELVRRSVAEKWDPIATTLLFVADRAVHAKDIESALAAGKTVLCDRFVHSTYAYQSVTLAGRLPDPRAFVAGLHAGWCPMPDKVLLFQADPAKCVQRVAKRGAASTYEKAGFLAQVQDAYLAEARRDAGRFTVLDAERDIEVVGKDALALVRSWLS